MAESMQGLHRTCRCAEVTTEMVGKEVTLMGWVAKARNKGGLVFVDLRDRSGIMQLIFENGSIDEEGFTKAGKLRSEFVIAVTGTVEKRGGAVNENLATGEIELRVKSLRVLAEADVPPFPIEENSKTKDEIRLKYRYLDLRRPDLQRNIMMKSKVAQLTRQFFTNEGFLEIETPMLGKSTPEGARDYLVPSRVHPGSFYGLPQSPQLYKQLLMCSGFDRYIQIARCFRDEDLRADRQPEFTQIDMELSFVDVDDVIDVNERYLAFLFKEVLDIDVKLPIQRITWQEAMDRFGSDKPDMRFGMELHDVSDIVKDCGFGVFTGALENGGSVRGINAEGQGAMPRKKIDKLVEFVKGYGAKGLAYIAIAEDGTRKSSFAKFMKDEEMDALVKAMDGKPGDLLLFAADKTKLVYDVLGALRLELAKQMDLLDKNEYRFLSGARRRTVSQQCTIRSPCLWKRICRFLTQIREKSVQKHTISFLTEMRSVAVVFVSIRMISRKECLRHLVSQKKLHMSSSDSFWTPSNTEFRLTLDWHTALIDLLCLWQRQIPSVTLSHSRR